MHLNIYRYCIFWMFRNWSQRSFTDRNQFFLISIISNGVMNSIPEPLVHGFKVVLRAAVQLSSMKALQTWTFYHSIPTVHAVLWGLGTTLKTEHYGWLGSTQLPATTLDNTVFSMTSKNPTAVLMASNLSDQGFPSSSHLQPKHPCS